MGCVAILSGHTNTDAALVFGQAVGAYAADQALKAIGSSLSGLGLLVARCGLGCRQISPVSLQDAKPY